MIAVAALEQNLGSDAAVKAIEELAFATHRRREVPDSTCALLAGALHASGAFPNHLDALEPAWLFVAGVALGERVGVTYAPGFLQNELERLYPDFKMTAGPDVERGGDRGGNP